MYLPHGDGHVASLLAMTEIDGYLCAHGLNRSLKVRKTPIKSVFVLQCYANRLNFRCAGRGLPKRKDRPTHNPRRQWRAVWARQDQGLRLA